MYNESELRVRWQELLRLRLDPKHWAYRVACDIFPRAWEVFRAEFEGLPVAAPTDIVEAVCRKAAVSIARVVPCISAACSIVENALLAELEGAGGDPPTIHLVPGGKR